jgi:hypothetical protein
MPWERVGSSAEVLAVHAAYMGFGQILYFGGEHLHDRLGQPGRSRSLRKERGITRNSSVSSGSILWGLRGLRPTRCPSTLMKDVSA